jgi:[acyl-carrier-protein] S-malonyltransferase
VVISGHKGAVERAMALAKQKGAKLVKALPVSAPFHSKLMAPAAARLAAELEKIEVSTPRLPVVSNVTAEPTRDAGRIRALLVEQVTACVRWEESVKNMAQAGVTSAYEVGPGKVLAGLCKRIAPAMTMKELLQ